MNVSNSVPIPLNSPAASMPASCPVTQLPYFYKSEWTGINLNHELSMTFILIGGNILLCRLSGYASRDGARKGLLQWKRYIAETIPNRPYVLLLDFSALKGASAEARLHYINSLRRHLDQKLAGMVFFGATAFMRLSIKLGIRMYPKYNLKLVKTYADAVHLAQKMIQHEGKPIPIGFEWKLQLDGFSSIYELVEEEVLHLTLTGCLEESHLEAMQKMRERIFLDLSLSRECTFIILNLTGVTGSSFSARKSLIRQIRHFYASRPKPLFIVYGASPLLKTMINFAKALLPSKITNVRDYESALALVHQDKSKAREPAEEKPGGEVREFRERDQIRHFVDELLDYLGNINWEGKGFYGDAEPVDPSHPFKPVFDAIALIKTEIDMLFQERKEAEEELRESEERFKSLSQNTPDIIYTLDTNGTITYVNPAWETILGHKRKDAIGRNFADFVDESDRRQIREFLMTSDRMDFIRDLSVTLLNKAGTPRLFNMNSAPNYHSGGQLTGMVGILKDVTDHRRLEAQFQQAQKMEAIGTLAGGIAHDFNNLLMGIQGYVSLMLLNKNSGNPDYEKLRSIEKQVQSGADLTRQLLGFARAGKYEVKPTDLNEIITKSAAMFGRTRKEIKMHENLQSDLWTVEVDRGQIEQALLNLYINAWQAMPAGGDLYLSTQNTDLEEDYTKALDMKPGHYVKIMITDTGIGMDEKTRKRIFEPFFTTKEMGRGTGLGLASAYGIIKGHCGLINVYSEKGHGATFNIYIPPSEASLPKEIGFETGTIPGSETILIDDDEEIVLKVNKELLQTLGYTILTAPGGPEAIRIYRNSEIKIDLIILDMIMPGVNGKEVFEELKKINPDVKVILSSGYSINGEASRIMESGCKAFIQKPFNLNQISKIIRKILDS